MPRSFDEELARATDRPAFANGTEGDIWMGQWCERCEHDKDPDNGCSLIMVALMNQTPAAWGPAPESHNTQYACWAFKTRTPVTFKKRAEQQIPGQITIEEAIRNSQ